MHNDQWDDPDDDADYDGGGVLDAFDYATPATRDDDDLDDWGAGDATITHETAPAPGHYPADQSAYSAGTESTESPGWNQPVSRPESDADEPTDPQVLTVSVTNAAGTITATATLSGWLQRVQLSPEATRLDEMQLAQHIIATAKLASMKGRASERTLVQNMLTYQGVDPNAARDYVDQYMDLPTADQAADAEAQARARYFRGEY